MKQLLPLLAAALGLLFLPSLSFAEDDAGAAGTPGVEDGTCWKNSSGNEIEVGVRGTLHGDQEITVTEGTDSGTGTGTPDPDGGCAESSSISVGSECYRVDNGGMEWKNPAGKWINMTKVKCDDDESAESELVILVTEEGIGALPA
tara:strand:- start:950 stop:1387 length:438 start_codon:yes stop_codon:yes gene_type:complete